MALGWCDNNNSNAHRVQESGTDGGIKKSMKNAWTEMQYIGEDLALVREKDSAKHSRLSRVIDSRTTAADRQKLSS